LAGFSSKLGKQSLRVLLCLFVACSVRLKEKLVSEMDGERISRTGDSSEGVYWKEIHTQEHESSSKKWICKYCTECLWLAH
jgi:hypothetical protein